MKYESIMTSVAVLLTATVPLFSRAKDIDVVAVYYPHWHQYPKGTEWFGEKWNQGEWNFVKTAVPRYPGHRVPMVPLTGYLDGKDPKDVETEIALASNAGIDVFLYDYYYYGGKVTQEEAIEEGFLKAANRDRMKFALMWCYHERRDQFRPPVDQKERRILMALDHTPEEFLGLIDLSIERYFRCPEYWRKDGKLFFSIFNGPYFVEMLGEDGVRKALAAAREKVRAAGLGEIHFNAQGFPPSQQKLAQKLGFDSTTDYNIVAAPTPSDLATYESLMERSRARWEAMKAGPLPYFPVVTTGWDCSARCPRDARLPWSKSGYPFTLLITNSTPEKFEMLLRDAKKYVENDPKKGGVVYVNAWNEYTECPGLVPTIRECDFMLRSVARVFGRKPADKLVGCAMKRWWDPKSDNGRAIEFEVPTFENVKYGPHYRQGMDVWLPKDAKGPVPCIVYIHGGAWTDGVRLDAGCRELLTLCRKEGLALATISYRMIPDARDAGIVPPVKAPIDDAIAAVRHILAHASEWKIDPAHIGLTGGSAGACSSLIASLSDDNALGIRAVCVQSPQTTLDPQEMRAWIPNANYGAHAFGYGYGAFETWLANREKHLAQIATYSPAALVRKVTPAKAPVFLYQCGPGELARDPTHAPQFCARFEELCRARGIACRAGGYGDLVSELGKPLSAASVPELKWALPRTATREGDVVTFRVAPEQAGQPNMAWYAFDIRPYLGQELSLTMKVRAKGLSKPAAHWLGPKFMLQYRNEFTGEMQYPGLRFPPGDLDGEYTLTVPLYGVGAESAELGIGLQSASGEISFDLSTLRVSAAQKLFPPKNVGYKVAYPERVAKRPVLRGTMVSPDLGEKDVADLAAWGGRLMRFPFHPIRGKGDVGGKPTKEEAIAKFGRDVGAWLDVLEKDVLGWARKHGLMVVVDMHMYPYAEGKSVFDDDELFESFLGAWKTVATRLRGNEDVIYGYDIINEPIQHGEAKYGYFGLQERVARAIRAIDPETTIILESNNADAPDAYSYMNALDMDNVIYQVHVYQPLTYTHQLVGPARKDRSPYPRAATKSEGAVDKDYLRKVVSPVLRFQREHGCRILVGEFSVAAWAEGGALYLDDLISIFEEYGWDWTYHAFREATLWSVEHEARDSAHRWKAKTETDRKKVLCKWLGKNRE